MSAGSSLLVKVLGWPRGTYSDVVGLRHDLKWLVEREKSALAWRDRF